MDRISMIGDGFFPIRDHLRAIFDTFRSRDLASFAIRVTSRLRSDLPAAGGALVVSVRGFADEGHAASLDHDLHARSDREAVFLEPAS
ncbi:MAG TPA: hypothetical protein VF883_14545 [Thermoanaerobaculia bacterium]